MGLISQGVTLTKLERLTRVKHSSLFGLFASYKKLSVANMTLGPQVFNFAITHEWAN